MDPMSPRSESPSSKSSVLTRLDVRGVPTAGDGELRRLLPAPASPAADGESTAAVQAILDQVRAEGDRALRDLTERFDGVRLDALRVADDERKAALDTIPADLRDALEAAYDNIVAYHRTQFHPEGRHAREGITIREIGVAVDRAGLYIPGGRAAYPSTVLMTAAPARVAGVDRLAMCSPPGPDGRLAPSVLAASAVAGVDEVYRVGGAQAIAALAYGTDSIPAVDVIVGPGNRYVAIAERLVAGQGAVGVPSAFTGPSEVAVVADDTTPVAFAAVDLVVQAEHGPDGLAYLITWSEAAATAITAEVARLTGASPRRAEIRSTLERGGYAVLVDGPEQAMAVANAVAAEHLELMCHDPESLLPLLRSAGAVFLGPWAPASLGDYAAGPNHVLPTARSARFGSALRVDDFRKHIHVVDVDQAGLSHLAPHVVALATSEGLAAHADSVRLRLDALAHVHAPAQAPASAGPG
ncbi:MAG TPA: histidinol dehydrogenase [Acidimicrobiales bacterium]